MQVDIVFTDFSKAYDRVNHNILINVLDKIGFGEPLLSYLSHRRQFVLLFGENSSTFEVSSGVPQGSRRTFITHSF